MVGSLCNYYYGDAVCFGYWAAVVRIISAFRLHRARRTSIIIIVMMLC